MESQTVVVMQLDGIVVRVFATMSGAVSYVEGIYRATEGSSLNPELRRNFYAPNGKRIWLSAERVEQ